MRKLVMALALGSLLVGCSSSQMIVGEAGPGEPRLSFEEIVAVVKAAGFGKVDSIHREHNLYEVKIRDERGQRVEVFVIPETGALQVDLDTGKFRTHRLVLPEKPRTEIPVADIIALVEAAGYHSVFSVEYEHALYEVKAIDSGGQRVELFVHSKSGELLRNPKTGKPMFEKID